jgi:hypothetical protein
MTSEGILKSLLERLLPNRAAPVLGRVLKTREGPGKTAYAVDVRIVKAGSLEDTEQTIADVPLSPIWVGKKKRGVYAIPPKDSLVVVEFLEWNPAFPYVAGVWADEYDAAEFGADKLVVTDGESVKIIIDSAEQSVSVDNGRGSFLLTADALSAKFKDESEARLEDGKATLIAGRMQVVLGGNKAAIRNGSKSLFTVLDAHFGDIIGMKTAGSPASHQVSPDDVQKFMRSKTDIGELLEA